MPWECTTIHTFYSPEMQKCLGNVRQFAHFNIPGVRMCEFDAADHERKVPHPTGDEKSTKIYHSGHVKRPPWERPPGSDSGPGGSNLSQEAPGYSAEMQKCLGNVRQFAHFTCQRCKNALGMYDNSHILLARDAKMPWECTTIRTF